jgi:hypothetical protein
LIICALRFAWGQSTSRKKTPTESTRHCLSPWFWWFRWCWWKETRLKSGLNSFETSSTKQSSPALHNSSEFRSSSRGICQGQMPFK